MTLGFIRRHGSHLVRRINSLQAASAKLLNWRLAASRLACTSPPQPRNERRMAPARQLFPCRGNLISLIHSTSLPVFKKRNLDQRRKGALSRHHCYSSRCRLNASLSDEWSAGTTQEKKKKRVSRAHLTSPILSGGRMCLACFGAVCVISRLQAS